MANILLINDLARAAKRRKSGYGNLTSGAGRRLRRVFGMFKEGPRYGDNPAKPGRDGWLYSEQQQKLRYFAPNNFFAQ